LAYKGENAVKLATVIGPDGLPQLGALINDDKTIALLQAGLVALEGAPSPHFSSMLAFLQAGAESQYKAYIVQDFVGSKAPKGTSLPVTSTTFLSPLPVPESLRDGMAFEEHIINSIRTVGLGRFGKLDEMIEKWFGRRRSIAYNLNKTWYERPIYYKGNRFSVVGHDAMVRIPAYTKQFDYEMEWAIIIGKGGRDIPPSKAHDHIAGYTIFNDFSARDVQMREMKGRLGPAKGKDFDTGNAIGPWMVTADDIPDPYNLTMITRVNGEEWSRGTTADMHWTFEKLISYISASETLYPGEIIGSGTCSGRQGKGSGLELGRNLKAGDVVELEVEQIGTLRNRIAPPLKGAARKTPRRR
jgi:2-keto-4-pentenoate hydratase/2-oxohepta-3-ene-1,7-dioic acid hydratase in catechol pathway